MSTLLFDEGPGAGLGHRRRMEALALELHARGQACRLTPLDGAGHVEAPLVVVDSYRARADELPVDADTIVAIDDLARDLAVDVLVDPSPGADASKHHRARRVLAGAQYALIAPPAAAGAVPPDAVVTRVLVTTGAADSAGIGARIAAEAKAALPDVDVRLVVGPWGAPEVPAGIAVVAAPPTLAGEMAAVPLVVTAGGVSMLEACALGRAVIAVTLAENQRIAVDALAADGAVVSVSVDDVASAIAALAADPRWRRALGDAARAVVDGNGAARIAEELLR